MSTLAQVITHYAFTRMASAHWYTIAPIGPADFADLVQAIGFTLGTVLSAGVLVYIAVLLFRHRSTMSD